MHHHKKRKLQYCLNFFLIRMATPPKGLPEIMPEVLSIALTPMHSKSGCKIDKIDNCNLYVLVDLQLSHSLFRCNILYINQ